MITFHPDEKRALSALMSSFSQKNVKIYNLPLHTLSIILTKSPLRKNALPFSSPLMFSSLIILGFLYYLLKVHKYSTKKINALAISLQHNTKPGGVIMRGKKLNKSRTNPIVPRTTPQDGAYLKTLKKLQEERAD
ncbi:hypothetical protein [Sporomusa sp. KB1]|jgi:hypothetical protein|uniref:hypothetical protein n=1 Tax=Sporomusa sp. KB1 TaxID=943346 RepID=UPI001C97EAD5|nr:hypothetical protein [Sporomusa sp. KB1]